MVMLNIRHENGIVYAQDGHVKITMSNLKQISEIIEKIKNCPYHMDEEGFKKRMHILDLLNIARLQFIHHEEQTKCTAS